MRTTQNLSQIKRKTLPIFKKYHIKKAGIFGSYAKGSANKKSDLDILVEFNDSLLTLVRIERELKESLGKNVDLLTYRGIHPLLKDKILKEEIRIL